MKQFADDDLVVGMATVYILRCADATFYVGWTANLPERLTRHKNGTACTYTAARRPVELVSEKTTDSAVARERQIKRWTHAKERALIDGDLTLLKRL